MQAAVAKAVGETTKRESAAKQHWWHGGAEFVNDYDFLDDTDEFMSSYFNSSNLLRLVARWKIHLLVVTIAAIGLSFLFSSPLFIKPKYRSFAVVYPSNLIPYSSETPSEQMLQLLKSEDIALAMAKKFKLAQHYNIDTTHPKYISRLKKEYQENVEIKRTEFESVIIEVYDTDREQACQMVKEIINLLNDKARTLQREKTAEVVAILDARLADKQQQIDSIQTKLLTLRKDFHIYDFNIQLKEYTRGYLQGVNTGRGNTPVYQEMFSNLTDHGGEYLFLGSYLASMVGAYNDIKQEYDKAVSDMNKVLTYTNMVSSPIPADSKAYPIRWLIVLISTTASIILMLIIISILESMRLEKKAKTTVTS